MRRRNGVNYFAAFWFGVSGKMSAPAICGLMRRAGMVLVYRSLDQRPV